MSEIKAALWLANKDHATLMDIEEGCDALHECATIGRGDTKLCADDIPLYTQEQLDKAIEERDILIRDLRKELNERRYGRSADQ